MSRAGCTCYELAGIPLYGPQGPDEIHVSESSAHEVQELLEHPLLEFEDAITVSGEGSYLLPCRLLGMIPFKDIKVTPAEAGSVYVSGSTVGIYMETEGVLIIDTGEILCEGGTAREPAKKYCQTRRLYCGI